MNSNCEPYFIFIFSTRTFGMLWIHRKLRADTFWYFYFLAKNCINFKIVKLYKYHPCPFGESWLVALIWLILFFRLNCYITLLFRLQWITYDSVFCPFTFDLEQFGITLNVWDLCKFIISFRSPCLFIFRVD